MAKAAVCVRDCKIFDSSGISVQYNVEALRDNGSVDSWAADITTAFAASATQTINAVKNKVITDAASFGIVLGLTDIAVFGGPV